MSQGNLLRGDVVAAAEKRPAVEQLLPQMLDMLEQVNVLADGLKAMVQAVQEVNRGKYELFN